MSVVPTAPTDAMGPIRPYGDTTGDGMVQLSFTLPMPHSKVAEGAAVQLANKMGMDPALVVHAKQMGEDYTFFVVYGRVHHLVDPSKVEVVERDFPLLTEWYLRGELLLDELITRRIALAEVEDAFQAMERGETLRSVVTF